MKTLVIEPGSPWENGHVESLNGKLRDELLVRAGVKRRIARALARHSTITRTMDRYAHVETGEQAEALAMLPPIEAGGRAGQDRDVAPDGRFESGPADHVLVDGNVDGDQSPTQCVGQCPRNVPGHAGSDDVTPGELALALAGSPNLLNQSSLGKEKPPR